MKHLNIDIQNASWLNEYQKEKLCKAFDLIRIKDVQSQGVAMLNLGSDEIASYKKSITGLLRALSVKGVSELLGNDRINEMGGHLEDLLECFSVWDSDDMDRLLEIESIYNYGYKDGENLNRLMRSLNID